MPLKLQSISVVSRRTYKKLQFFFEDEQWLQISEKVKILPMGVDVLQLRKMNQNNCESIRQFLGLIDKRIILFLGRLSEKKGVIYLLRSFARLVAQIPESRLLIAGDGEAEGEIRTEIDRLEIKDSALLVGYLSQQEKNDYLSIAEIIVIPSIITKEGDAEGLPVVLLEGLATRKICIATRESGADDIIRDKINGYLVNAKDTVSLEEILIQLMSLPQNSLTEIKNHASDTAWKYDWNIIGRDHFDHLFREFI